MSKQKFNQTNDSRRVDGKNTGLVKIIIVMKMDIGEGEYYNPFHEQNPIAIVDYENEAKA